MKKIQNKLVGTLGVMLLAFATALATLSPAGNVFAKDIDINTSDYGYGGYVVSVRGEGVEGAWDGDAVTFYYYPAYAELVKEDGKYYLDLYYNGDDGSTDPEDTGEVASITVRIYDADGNEVPFSPITVTPFTTRVELPFEEYGLDEGEYTIEVYAYNRDGTLLSAPYTFVVNFEIEDEVAVPDTGGLFQGTNISKTDYLITGLVAFGLIAIAGVMFIVRSDRKKR